MLEKGGKFVFLQIKEKKIACNILETSVLSPILTTESQH